MIKLNSCDVAVVGGGAAGMAAARTLAAAGKKCVIIDRNPRPGGILQQCIHNGFGLHFFKEELTGPEFACRLSRMAAADGVIWQLNSTVTAVERMDDGSFTVHILSGADGVVRLRASAVFMAMGCRERSRGNIAVPGGRPAGVFTAGAAQKLLNCCGMLPGKSAVIVGSGDIGLIMARRLRWCGVAVRAVVEIMPQPSGLPRNVAQCLDDFGTELYLEHSVVNIIGNERVEAVEVAPLGGRMADLSRKFRIDCDTVLFSVGLIPETELMLPLGVRINPATGGAAVDCHYQTSVPGIFAGGNVLHVHDLVDYAADESVRAAHGVIAWLNGQSMPDLQRAGAGKNLKYVVPERFAAGEVNVFAFRPLIVAGEAELTASADGRVVWRKVLRNVRPAEMLRLEFAAGTLPDAELLFELQEKR